MHVHTGSRDRGRGVAGGSDALKGVANGRRICLQVLVQSKGCNLQRS